MCRRTVVTLSSAIIVLLWLGVVTPADVERAQPPPPWIICGPNSLYMLLRGHDHWVGYDNVVVALHLSSEGVGLLDLEDAAKRLGFAAEVGHCLYDQMSRCQMPLIAHFGQGSSNPSSFTKGHFVVVIHADPSYVTFIDGTTADRQRYPRKTFEKYWSGYVLVHHTSLWSHAAWVVSGLALVAAGMVLWYHGQGTPLVGLYRGGHAAAIVLVLVALVDQGTSLARADDSTAFHKEQQVIWRTPRNSGLNALYLLLRYNGQSVHYAQLAATLRPDQRDTSLADLQDAAYMHGLRTTVVRFGPEELKRFADPVIVHIEDSAQAGGRFALALYRGGRNYVVVDGPTAQLLEVPFDQFRRAWSGYALVPESRQEPIWYVALAVALPTLLILVTWLVLLLFRKVQYPSGPNRRVPDDPLPCAGFSRRLLLLRSRLARDLVVQSCIGERARAID